MIAHKIRIISAQQLVSAMLVVLASLAMTVAFIAANSSAQSAENTGTANALKISPLRTDVQVEQGSSATVKVIVTNPSSETVSVRVIQNDFIAGDEDGTPAIYLEETEYAPSRSLKRFMTPIDNLTLAPNEARVVEVVLTVPADAEPGGYYGVVRFAPTSPDSGGQVNVSASVASLILMTVPGDTPEKLDLTDFDIRQDGSLKAFFTTGGGLTANVRFKNEGGVHAGPFGKVSVLKGNDIVYASDFNNKEQRDMILPNSARRWSIPLDNISGMGRYTVSATFTYGAQNQTIEVTETFWIIPKAVIIIAVVALITIIGAIVGVVVWRRRSRGNIGLSGAARKR